jgi:hypothetical protein
VSLATDIDVRLNYNASTGKGWNQVAPPNAANYYWEEVLVIAYDSAGNVIFGPTPLSEVTDPNAYIGVRIWKWNNGVYESYLPGDFFLMQKNKGYWVKAKQNNVFLRFPVSAQIAALSKSDTMLASIWRKGKRWIKTWVFAPTIALADTEDSPPLPPIRGLSSRGSSVSEGGGCFIATAAYGYAMAPHVRILREFRDRFLMDSTVGKAFISLYTTYSPPIADYIARHDTLQALVRSSLLPLVAASWVALKTAPLFGLALIMLVCFSFFGLVGVMRTFWKKRTRKEML